jgi:hypothetical protein
MQRVVSFYEKLPRGAAPEVKAKGLLGRYQAKYFGKNASAARTTTLPTTYFGAGNTGFADLSSAQLSSTSWYS